MTYLRPKVWANFKEGTKKKKKAADRRPGMDPKHLENIRKLPSCISGKTPCEAHHLRIYEERGVGLKATDKWAVPLTHKEHMDCHTVGSKKESAWFEKHGVDHMALAAKLWDAKDDLSKMRQIIEERGK